jgi:prophage regulatory protein
MYKIIPTKHVLKIRGNRSHSSHYSDIKNRTWTTPVKIGPRSSGWPEYEVIQLNQARIAGKSEEEVRELVLQLEASRKNGGDV